MAVRQAADVGSLPGVRGGDHMNTVSEGLDLLTAALSKFNTYADEVDGTTTRTSGWSMR